MVVENKMHICKIKWYESVIQKIFNEKINPATKRSVKRRQLYVDEFKKSYTASLPTAIVLFRTTPSKKFLPINVRLKTMENNSMGDAPFVRTLSLDYV